MALTFAENLKKIREENGWTLEEMAERLGSTKQVLSRYERGERTPKITMASHFADVLGIPLQELVGDDKDLQWQSEYIRAVDEKNKRSEEVPKTKEAKIISGGIDKMPEDLREQALKVMQTIFSLYFDGGKNDGT